MASDHWVDQLITSANRISDTKRAAIGFLFALPPLYFVSAAILKYELGVGFMFDPLASFLADPHRLAVFNIVSPVLFLGGLTLATALNLYCLLRFNWRREDSVFVATLTLEARPWNMLIVATSTLLFAVLVIYALLENFTSPL